MVRLAFASLYHWSFAGTEINIQRGEWMVSHVYSVLNRPEPALHHAKRCLHLTEKNKFDDFDLAYSYEAMARALFCSGNKSEGEKYFKLAEAAGKNIKQKEDRDIFQGDLKTGPWFGIKDHR